MPRLEDWAVKGVRRMACAAAVAQGLSRHDAKATVEKKTRGPGIGILAAVQGRSLTGVERVACDGG
jgi:hypothetical protein